MCRYEEGYDEHNDELVKEYMLKNGGPIPILEMTYINKTQPKPCDKEVSPLIKTDCSRSDIIDSKINRHNQINK